ncbi:MAG: hypothetical protein A2V66_10665 [Ignavibacteria bacterium RBG_13_36_8]|nr:MAG: hypothetical protein A2V66_10665 [Ignavibacteria bacterium RBG_13_36_8]
MKRVALFFCVLVLSAVNLLIAQDGAKGVIKHISGNIYFLQYSGGNMAALIVDERTLLIDTDMGGASGEWIKQTLKEINDAPIKYVVNTHYHGDHTNGNIDFGDSSIIIAHENTRKIRQMAFDSYNGFHYDPLPEMGLPEITFNKQMSLYFNSEQIDLIYMPKGHSDTDIVVWFRNSKVIHMGDIFRNGRLPYIDIAGGATVKGFINNLEKLISEIPDEYVIIPGHGEIANKEDLKYYYKRFADAVDFIFEKIKQNKTLEEVKTLGLPLSYDNYPASGLEIDMWIEVVYRDLKEEIDDSEVVLN